MKANERNIPNLMVSINDVVRDILVTDTTLCEEIRFRNGITLYDALKVEYKDKTFYVAINEITNNLTIWMSTYCMNTLLMDSFDLLMYKKKSIPALVIYAITRI